MKKVLLGVGAALVMASSSFADIIDYDFTMPDLGHTWYFAQELNVDIDASEINGATITFFDIKNSDNESNILYVQLLNEMPDGLWSYPSYPNLSYGQDLSNPVNQFEGQGINVGSLSDLTTTPETMTLFFGAAQTIALRDYLSGSDNSITIGMDPDCYYTTSKVRLSLITVPEPGSISMLLFGIVSLLGTGLALKRKKA